MYNFIYNTLTLRKNKDLLGLFLTQGIIAAATIFLGKLITKFVQPDELGTYNLQLGVFTFFMSAFANPIIQSFKAHYPNENNHTYIYFYLRLLLRVILWSSIPLIIIALSINGITFKIIPLILINAVSQAFFFLLRDWINIEQQHNKFGIINIINVFFNILLLFVFARLKIEVSHYILWLILAATNVISIASIFATINFSSIQHNWRNKVQNAKLYTTQIIGFIKPLVALALFTWISQYFGRYILNLYSGTAQVGMYSASYGFGSKIALLNAPLITFLTPQVLKMVRNEVEDVKIDNTTWQMVLIYAIITLPCCIILAFFRKPMGLLFLSEQYQEGFVIIPIIALSFVFFTTISFLDIKLYACGRTKYILMHNISGSIFSIILSLLWIPFYGLQGAAWASCISFAIQLLIAIWFFKKAKITPRYTIQNTQ